MTFDKADIHPPLRFGRTVTSNWLSSDVTHLFEMPKILRWLGAQLVVDLATFPISNLTPNVLENIFPLRVNLR